MLLLSLLSSRALPNAASTFSTETATRVKQERPSACWLLLLLLLLLPAGYVAAGLPFNVSQNMGNPKNTETGPNATSELPSSSLNFSNLAIAHQLKCKLPFPTPRILNKSLPRACLNAILFLLLLFFNLPILLIDTPDAMSFI